MSYLEELLPEFRKGVKIRCEDWEGNLYIYLKDGTIYDEENNPINYPLNDIYEWFYNPRWELYKDPEPEWDYIIKNKCLCWFWKEENEGKFLGTLSYIMPEMECKFVATGIHYFKHCRPVQKDEVNFYEDKKDD